MNRRVAHSFGNAGWLLRLGICLILIWSILAPTQRRPALATTGPNIVLILTDDQRWDTLWAMRNVQSELVAHGMTFTNGFVVNSLCCPSRASILTGKYSHSTMVYDNSGLYGGFESFHDDDNTVATWLHDAGYRTGLIGKYLNSYHTTYVPPGWDQWVAFLGPNGSYYDYDLNDNGVVTHYGSSDADYSTDVLAGEADSFIRAAPAGQPLFMYFSPYASHAPWVPATKYEQSFKNLRPARPPNYNEVDASDKPAWVQSLPLLTEQEQTSSDGNRKNAYRTLLSVDDAVDTIIAALTDTGRLSDTLIVFASDNGLAFGEHRWRRKRGAYEEMIRIPMVVRYDPLIQTPRTNAQLVTNIDLAPTFAAIAGVPSPGADGMSMVPLFNDQDASWRGEFLIEHKREKNFSDDTIPTFCAVRAKRYTYVTYATGEEELYDLSVDRYELSNVASDPSYASVLASLRVRLQTLCDPPPPGFTFRYDVLPPSQPTDLAGTAPTPTEVDLFWTASTDNFAVTGYTVYRDGEFLDTVDGATLAYVDSTVLPGSTYTYTVDAFDASDNYSVRSEPFTITTP